MQTYHYMLKLAGIELPCSFRYPDTAGCFGDYVRETCSNDDALTVSEADWEFWPKTGRPVDAVAEYNLFTTVASTALLRYGRCAIHAAAFRRNGKAWLIAAGPGVGKSTQIRTLRELWPGEFSVISGDRPILEVREGEIIVHPSPWNGKERWFGAPASPLAGIILLQRGEENRMDFCSIREAVLSVYCSLIQSCETAELMQSAGDIAAALLQNIPVWRLTTHQVPDSTQLMYRTLFTEEDAKDEV